MGIDVGSTHVKASLIEVCDGELHELAVADRACAGLDAAGLVTAALAVAREVADRAEGPIAAIGIASMAETGGLAGRDGRATGPLLRWDRAGDTGARLALARDLDPRAVHAATGAPLVPKLPLLTWAQLARDGVTGELRWGFAADLVAAALTGRVATDHTLAGRSGAYRLPPSGSPLSTRWDPDLLAAVGADASLPPEVLLPGERAGRVPAGALPRATGAAIHLAGHDHAVAARIAGADRPGRVAHSLGTTEAVLALAPAGHPVDRARAGAEGISVVRGVDGDLEGVLAGSPAAGALIAEWRTRAGERADELLAASPAEGPELALPYPRGRQSPAPDPAARYVVVEGDATDPASELSAILHGLAAQGAWMRSLVAELTGAGARPRLVATGTPVRANRRLARLMASLAPTALHVVELAAPVASGAAALALEREGLAPRVAAPVSLVPPAEIPPGLAARFAAAVAAPTLQGAR